MWYPTTEHLPHWYINRKVSKISIYIFLGADGGNILIYRVCPCVYLMLIIATDRNRRLLLLSSCLARGDPHHAFGLEAAEDADGPDHLAVQVCLPGPHPVPQELSPHLKCRQNTNPHPPFYI